MHTALPAKDVLLVVSVRGTSQIRFITDLIKCTKKTNWLKMYNVCH